MQAILEFLHRLRDPRALVAWGGYAGMTLIIFAETGLLVGFFLPGDSLLVTAGLLSSQKQLVDFDIVLLGALLSVASILGNSVGYYIGKVTGPHLFSRENSLLFNRKHLERAHAFFIQYGGKAVVLGRFVPIVRTFVPFVAGAATMPPAAFGFYNLVGASAWVGLCLGAGFLFGNVPAVKEHFSLVTIGIVVVSLLPMVVELVSHRRRGRA